MGVKTGAGTVIPASPLAAVLKKAFMMERR
jgi:hypothetical protein